MLLAVSTISVIYDIFFDNCTTRIRDLIIDAPGGNLVYPGTTASGSIKRNGFSVLYDGRLVPCGISIFNIIRILIGGADIHSSCISIY